MNTPEHKPDALTGRDEHIPQVNSLGEVAKQAGVCEPVFDNSETPKDQDSVDIEHIAKARNAGM